MEFKAVCMQEGVFVLTAGNDVVRMVPALNISVEEIEEGFARVEKAAAKLFAQLDCNSKLFSEILIKKSPNFILIGGFYVKLR